MSVMSHFSQNLKKLREDAGLTQSQLAEQLGISRGSISFYENEDRIPDIEVLARVSDRFHVSTDWLLGLVPSRAIDEDVKIVCAYTGLTEEAVGNIRQIYQKKKLNIEMNIPTDIHDIDMLSLLLNGNYYCPMESILHTLTLYPFKVRTVCSRLHKLLNEARKSYDDRTLNEYKLTRDCNECAKDLDIAEFDLYRSTMVVIDVARKAAEKEIADAKETMEELQTLCL